MQDLR